MTDVIVIDHPLVQDKLTIMRSKHTNSGVFRLLLKEVSQLLCYEATRNLETYLEDVVTPLGITTKCPMIKSKQVAFVSVLRAGLGMLDGVLSLIPTAPVGHIGLYRDPKTYFVIEYYYKMPQDMQQKHVIVLDPIIATGHSSVAAVNRVKETDPLSITFISLVVAPEGLNYFQQNHPDVKLYTAAIDEKLDARNYIVPGLGDAGDRMYGTA